MDFSRFDYGAIHPDQRARLGLGIRDVNGERWGYIRVREAMSFGQVARASKHADLVTTDPGAVSQTIATGSDKLTTSNGFVLGGVEQDLRGAVGYISDGAGQSQQFYILENTDDVAKVFVLTGNTNRNKNQGWVAALNTTTRFLLVFPGEGRQGDGTADIVEGVMQADATAADLGKFCWVKRSGITPVRVDASATDLTSGGQVVPTAGGLVQGATNSSRAIGQALGATSTLDADTLALVNLHIDDGPLSYAYSNEKNAFNEVTIRN